MAYGEPVNGVLRVMIECLIDVEVRSSQTSVEVAAASDQLPGWPEKDCSEHSEFHLEAPVVFPGLP